MVDGWTDGQMGGETEINRDMCVLVHFLALPAKKVSKQQHPSSSGHTQHPSLGS